MRIITTFDLPKTFEDKLPYENKTKLDNPLWTKSLAVFDVDLETTNPVSFKLESLDFLGYVPFCTTQISNKSPHPSIRHKTFRPGFYVGMCNDYNPNHDTWGHKAFYIFNESVMSDKRITFNEKKSVLYSDPKSGKLISAGDHRVIPADFINPIWNKNQMIGINIHRGPKKNNGDGNYSLGCVTVEHETFDKFMQIFQYHEVIVYIHEIERLISLGVDKSSYFGNIIHNNGLQAIYNTIQVNLLNFKIEE